MALTLTRRRARYTLTHRRQRERRDAFTISALFAACGAMFAPPFVMLAHAVVQGGSADPQGLLTLTVGLGAFTVGSLTMALVALIIGASV